MTPDEMKHTLGTCPSSTDLFDLDHPYIGPLVEILAAQAERIAQLEATCLVKSHVDAITDKLTALEGKVDRIERMAVEAHSRTTEVQQVVEGMSPDDVVRIVEAIRR